MLRRYAFKRPRICFPRRAYSQTEKPKLQSARQNAVGILSPASAFFFVTTAAGLYFYFDYKKRKHIEEREKALQKSREGVQYGRPKVGGPFALTTHNNEPYTDQNLLGHWSFVYFGFTNCPDICPTELDKVGDVLATLEKDPEFARSAIPTPVFISVDPARDSTKKMAKYLKDFHPSFVGLVGPYEDIKKVCKAYRVYFSTPKNADPKGDYLVDHSIFIYLMDLDGQFVEAFGQNVAAEQIVTKVKEVVAEYKTKV